MNTISNTSMLPDWHPISVYYQEKEIICQLLEELSNTISAEDLYKYVNIFNELGTIEKRFSRKENQLFPFLENKGWVGPSQGMWSFHDNLREQIRLIKYYIKTSNTEKIRINTPFLVDGIYRLMHIEETVLFPNALDILEEKDWKAMRKGEVEIGWMLAKNPPSFSEAEHVHPSEDFTKRELSFSLENTSHYDEGYMTVEQVNLLFRTMPLDLTYVDENDKMICYNRGEERVFPRSAGIIGEK